MSELTRNLRRIIQTHDTVVPENLILSLLDELEAQANMIHDLRSAIDSHYQRQGDAIVRLGKEIDRVKGVHGA